MTTDRPSPEEMLDRAAAEDALKRRGRLKVFFGAAPGVGKTFAMLEAARAQRADHRDVVIGWVETHGRKETEALTEGFEHLPPRSLTYQGIELHEFDLDAALKRRASLILVDELAHTNAEGSRHAKRWQDVEELLDAGIDVYTTLNVQHIESLNDVVAQITHVIVRETVPDAVLERANEIELVDLPPDELLERLREGKVYVPAQAERAIESFFRRGNLLALRELALRSTADRVDAQMDAYRREQGIALPWHAGEKLIVCVGPAPQSAGLVRAARRMAAALRAPWYAVSVETPASRRLSTGDKERIIAHLRLAESLGAEAVTLSGTNVADEVLQFARKKNISKIVCGKPTHARWKDRLRGSLLDELVRGSGGIDVFVPEIASDSSPRSIAMREAGPALSEYGGALGIVALTTLLALALRTTVSVADLAMIHLLGVVVAALAFGRTVSIVAAVVSIAAFDFFMVPPYLTFAVGDLKFVLTFFVMLVVAITISSLATRVRDEAATARSHARRTAQLYAMSRNLAGAAHAEEIATLVAQDVAAELGSESVLLVASERGELRAYESHARALGDDAKEMGVARWVLEHGQIAGVGTDTLAGARGLYIPLRGVHGTVGVLGVIGGAKDSETLAAIEQYARQATIALERAALADKATEAEIAAETERMRSALLSAVSHDLRTPLAVITGSASALLDTETNTNESSRRELLVNIRSESERLSRLVADLLDMSRVQAGALQLHLEWHSIEELVGASLEKLEQPLRGRPIRTDIPPDLPLVRADGRLLEQVLTNLLENAANHTPAGSPIEIVAQSDGSDIVLEVRDRGPGLSEPDRTRMFEKFYRGTSQGSGFGLGLAIAKGFVEAHGGTIEHIARDGGGAVFRICIPTGGAPPQAMLAFSNEAT